MSQSYFGIFLLSNMVIVTEASKEVKIVKSRYHSIEVHNYWTARNKKCPYCISGSKPVPKAMINGGS